MKPPHNLLYIFICLFTICFFPLESKLLRTHKTILEKYTTSLIMRKSSSLPVLNHLKKGIGGQKSSNICTLFLVKCLENVISFQGKVGTFHLPYYQGIKLICLWEAEHLKNHQSFPCRGKGGGHDIPEGSSSRERRQDSLSTSLLNLIYGPAA